MCRGESRSPDAAQRAALAAWRAAVPGSMQQGGSRLCGAALRAAPRPGHGDVLLPVAGQRRLTGLADAGAVRLQAGQHDLVAVLHLRPAKSRHVAGAGIMPLLLRRSGGCDQNQRNDEQDFGHLISLHTEWTRWRRSIAFSGEVETGSLPETPWQRGAPEPKKRLRPIAASAFRKS